MARISNCAVSWHSGLAGGGTPWWAQCNDRNSGMTHEATAFVIGSLSPTPPSRAGQEAMNREWFGSGCGVFKSCAKKWWFVSTMLFVNDQVHLSMSGGLSRSRLQHVSLARRWGMLACVQFLKRLH